MKRTSLAMVAAIFVLSACGKGSAVKDFGELFDNGTKSLQALGKDFEAAKDGKTVAAAIDKFVELMKSFKEKADALEKKHGINAKGEMPPELKQKADAFQKAAEELGKGPMANAMMKYSSAAEVQAAMAKLDALH
jgi:ABC-type glycerol-3-phosphate transport system substrate-binding protein